MPKYCRQNGRLRANRHICSELGIQFSTNLRKSPWAPQGTPKVPQGDPKCRQMRHGFGSKMPSNATWFRQQVPKCRQMRHGFDNILIEEYGPYGPQGPWAHKTKMFLLSSYYVVIIILIMMIQGQGQGPGAKPRTQKRRWAGPGPWTAPFLGPWPLGSLAQSMHKSVVHAQEISCVYTRDSFVYTQ